MASKLTFSPYRGEHLRCEAVYTGNWALHWWAQVAQKQAANCILAPWTHFWYLITTWQTHQIQKKVRYRDLNGMTWRTYLYTENREQILTRAGTVGWLDCEVRVPWVGPMAKFSYPIVKWTGPSFMLCLNFQCLSYFLQNSIRILIVGEPTVELPG